MPIEEKTEVSEDVEVEAKAKTKKKKVNTGSNNEPAKQASLAECNRLSRAAYAGIKAQKRLEGK